MVVVKTVKSVGFGVLDRSTQVHYLHNCIRINFRAPFCRQCWHRGHLHEDIHIDDEPDEEQGAQQVRPRIECLIVHHEERLKHLMLR